MLRIILFTFSIFSWMNSVELIPLQWDNNQKIQNNAPIIGIVAQETSWEVNHVWPDTYNSYIAASYIKFVEGGGARAVPIW